MARDHAVIRLDMWGDDDWRRLTPPAQHLYMLLLTAPSLNLCGVADWRPARLSRLAGGWSIAQVRKAAQELTEQLFLVIDDDTEEVLIRSFVRHDGLMKQPNMATAMATAHAAIASPLLRGVVVHELRRLQEKQPDLAGWRSRKACDVLGRDSIDPSVDPSVKGSVDPSGDPSVNPNPNPSVDPCPTPTPTPTPNSSSNEEEELLSAEADEPPPTFADFYNAYPRKEARRNAEKAWNAATKRATPADILDGLTRFPFADERRFQPLPASWLNADRWADQTTHSGLTLVQPDGQPTHLPGHVVADLLGPDVWSPPRGPDGLDADELWEWNRARQLEHIAERQAAARAKLAAGA